MKDLKPKMGETQRKLKIDKELCDSTYPLIFIVRNNIFRFNKMSNKKSKQRKNILIKNAFSFLKTIFYFCVYHHHQFV